MKITPEVLADRGFRRLVINHGPAVEYSRSLDSRDDYRSDKLIVAFPCESEPEYRVYLLTGQSLRRIWFVDRMEKLETLWNLCRDQDMEGDFMGKGKQGKSEEKPEGELFDASKVPYLRLSVQDVDPEHLEQYLEELADWHDERDLTLNGVAKYTEGDEKPTFYLMNNFVQRREKEPPSGKAGG